MRRWTVSILVTQFLLLLVAALPASADRDVSGTPSTDDFVPEVILEGVEAGLQGADDGLEPVDSVESSSQYEYEWLLACLQNRPGQPMFECAAARTCPSEEEMRWWLWARQVRDADGQPTPDAGWQPVLTECRLTRPPEIASPRPQVTDALVLSEVKRLGLPRLAVEIQPTDKTLVNFETIFYAEPAQWARTVELLDYRVDVEAEPTTYVWQFGDGSSTSTHTPGAPYPAKDVTHLYSDAGVSVAPRVDTAYEISYRVDGGAWQTISETVPAAGLPAELRIREATAVLVGD